MSSRSFLDGYYGKPRIDHDLIAEHSDGIIVLSGCLNGEVAQALLRNDFNFALESARKMQDIVRKRKLLYRNSRPWSI
jgi:DNA polymerase-3 subunit alpha